jgi:two-component system sensor kinase FixL
LAAQELSATQEELASVYRMTAIGAVASNLAHELNQPLTALRCYASGLRTALARRKPDLEQAVAEAADGVEANAALASSIVDRAREPTCWARIDIGLESLAGIAADTAATFAGARVEIEVAIAPSAERVSVDRLHIQQVLVNLIRNAADAMLETGGRRVVVSATRASHSEVEVRVRDQGPGIPDEVRERLFSPFVTTKTNGVGIGLAICRTIIEAHGGRIWAESAPEGGTEIVFTVPSAGD